MLEAVLGLLGRTHPLALHVPIGTFAALLLFELLAWLRGRPLELHVRLTLLTLLFLSSTLSVISGLLLGGEPGYSGDTLTQHKISGIAFAALTLLLLAAAAKAWRRFYAATFVAATVLMTVSGHLGATMTHGDEFLTAPITAYLTPKDTNDVTPSGPDSRTPNHATLTQFDRHIRPILQQTCISCHGESKAKGGLAVHTYAALMQGGEVGPSVIAGDPENSELITRMLLPLDDEDHMPPAKKPQPSQAQIRVLEAWIRAGATENGEFTLPADVSSAAPAEPTTPSIEPKRQSDSSTAPPVNTRAIAALRERLVTVETYDPATSLLAVDCGPAAGLVPIPELITLLEPLTESIGHLSLSRIAIDASLMSAVAKMKNLHQFAAAGTGLTDEHLGKLAGLAKLHTLNLTQNSLTDASALVLNSMTGLKVLFAWKSGLAAPALNGLSDRGVRVDLGVLVAAPALETEEAVKLSSDAPPVGAAAPVAVEGIARPTNTTCPVSGAAVNGDIVVVFKGKATAVCCEKCAAKVLADSLAKP